MGMDYYGNNGQDFRLGLTSHQYIGALLYQLGADLREWAVANDGDEVSAEACRAWAGLLRTAVTRLPELRVPTELRAVVAAAGLADALGADTGGIVANINPPGGDVFEFFAAPHAGLLEVPAKAADGPWILDFCDFLESCDGFTQW